MHSSRTLIFVSLVLTLAGCVFAITGHAETVYGPLLGFARTADGTTIRPMIGIPGAAALTARLPLDAGISNAAISPAQDYILAVRTDDGSVAVVNLKADAITLSPIAGSHTNPSLFAISPLGSSAASYDPATGTVQVFGHFPQAQIVREFDASGISGTATGMALSDDGAVVLLNVASVVPNRPAHAPDYFAGIRRAGDRPGQESVTDQLWSIGASGTWPLGTASSAVGAFFPNRHDAVIADDATQTVFTVSNIDQAAMRAPLLQTADGIDSFSNVAVSGDGASVFVASKTGQIAVVDMQTRQPRFVDCQCRPDGFYRLTGNSIFQLTHASDQPTTVLDNSSTEPRVFIIPPAAPDSTITQ
jgi:hypothetical protein